MRQIKIGVIGTGPMAATMIGAMKRVADVQVAAVASATGNIQRARTFASTFAIADAYAETSSLLSRPDIDLVYIANRNSAHAATAISAMDAGKAVLCEKPFALTEAEGQRVAECAERNSVFFMEAIWTLLLPAYQRSLQIITENRVGIPSQLSAAFGYPMFRDTSGSVFQLDGGGVLLDRAVYPISLALRLMGPAVAVNAIIERDADGLDVGCSMQLTHASGCQSQLAVSLTSLLSNTAVVACTLGTVTLGPPLVGAERVTTVTTSAPTISGYEPSQSIATKLRAQPLVRRLKRLLIKSNSETHSYGLSQYIPLIGHVVERLRSGHKQSDVVPIDFSLSIVRIIDAAKADQMLIKKEVGGSIMKIAYLMNTYPMTSTTFVRREIEALERLGIDVSRFAVRRWEKSLVDPLDQSEQLRTNYLMSHNLTALFLSVFLDGFQNFAGLLRGMFATGRLAHRAGGGSIRHAAYLLQAVHLRRITARVGIAHVHAHFASNATTVAMLCHIMGGPAYSFTMHGPDEFDETHRLSLDVKLDNAAFAVAISHYCRSQMLRYSDCTNADKIKIVHCAVVTSEFASAGPINPNNQTFVCVGRLCSQKAQTMLPEIVGDLIKDFPNLKVVLIGDGETRGEIETAISNSIGRSKLRNARLAIKRKCPRGHNKRPRFAPSKFCRRPARCHHGIARP